MALAAPICTDRTFSQSIVVDVQCNEPQASGTRSVETAGNTIIWCVPINE